MTRSARRRPRGLTMAIAILLLALVAVALVSVAQLVRDDARRTYAERDGAQVRAFMLAGIETARAELEQRGTLPAELVLPLPPPFAETPLSVLSRLADGQWHVRVRSRLGDRAMESEATFAQADGAWRVIAATPAATTSPTK